MAFLVMLGIVLWLVFAIWPAYIAKTKGYSFILFLILSWFVSFILTLLVVLLLKDKTLTPADKTADEAAEAALDKEEGRA